MSEQKSYCPQCHSEVVFFQSGDTATCPVCSFQYRLNAGPGEVPPTIRSTTASIGRVILKVILIAVGIVVLGIAVLFAGCVLLLSTNGHF